MIWVLLLLGCNKAEVACEEACPQGTRRVDVNTEAIAPAGTFGYSRDQTCEVFCEPEVTCLAPNVPLVSRGDDGVDVFTCQPVEGFTVTPIAPANEVDTRFGERWSDRPASISLSTGLANTLAIGAADIDGDGADDLLLATLDQVYQARSLGDGSFEAGQLTPLGFNVRAAVPADLDDDGVLDWFTVDFGLQVQVLLGDGLGGLSAPIAGPTLSARPAAIWAEDIDDDGVIDLLLQGWTSGGLAILFGVGDGSFAAPLTPPGAIDTAASIDLGDLDGDGLVDLVSNQSGGLVLWQASPRSFITAHSGFLADAPGAFPVFIDWSGDGQDDLAASLQNAACTSSCTLGWRSKGDGSFVGGDQPYFSDGAVPWGATFPKGDLDGDGLLEPMAFSGLGLWMMFGPGEPAQASVPLSAWASQAVPADLDGDGRDEVLLVDQDGLVQVVWP